MKLHVFGIAGVMLVAMAGQVNAGFTLTEDFEGSFPAWESGWLGTNSNVQNYYGVGEGRGNNPDGLWIQDGLSLSNETRINFSSTFAASLSSFDIDVTTFVGGLTFEIFDKDSVTLLSNALPQNNGAYTDPGSYFHFGVTSSNGIGGFRILGSSIEGNTSIDNVVVSGGASAVPEPASIAVWGIGAFGMAFARRKRRKMALAC